MSNGWWSVLLAALLVAGCGGEAEPPAAALDADLIRARVESYFVDGRAQTAQEVLAPLVDRPDAAAEDLVRAAILALALTDDRGASAAIERARALAPDDLSVAFLSGVIAFRVADFEAAEPHFRAVLQRDPSDLAARLWLADTLDNLGQTDEALSLLRQVRAAGLDADRQLYVNATYKLAMALRGQPEAEALLTEYNELFNVRKIKPPTELERGQRGWGQMRPPTARGVRDGPPSEPKLPAFVAGEAVDLDGAVELLAADIDADGRMDLVGWGPRGVTVARQTAPGQFATSRVSDRPTVAVAAGDIDEGDPQLRDDGSNAVGPNDNHHPALELACLQAGEGDAQSALVLYSLDAGGGWTRVGPGFAPLPGARGALFSDFDHDSLLDLLVAGGRGVTVLRNAGALREAGQTLQDVTPEAAALGTSTGLIAEDLDADNDVDYVVVTEQGLKLLDNRRGGGFADATAAWHAPPGAVDAAGVLAADVDEDGRADLVLTGPDGTRWARGSADGFAAPAPLFDAAGGRLALADLDLDGHMDLVHARGAEVEGRRGPLTGRSAPPAAVALVPAGPPLALADLDGDLDADIAVLSEGRATPFLADVPDAHALEVSLAGRKDNTHGVGAIVELRAGGVYRRIYARGEPLLFGLGAAPAGDVLRITWPNGVVEHLRDERLAAGQHIVVEQIMRVGGSCPFLYTWNGHEYVFVTDALGASPLGLPAAPGVMVPFNCEEDLKVRGDQLLPDGGELRLCLTEELREVTYLDRLALRAIDHPAEVEIQPNERFTFPPFPEQHVHTLRDVRPVARALAGNGQDVTEAVASVDDRAARPFRERAWQYTGLAEPWSVDFTLAETPEARAALAAAPRIRLLVTGWLQWGDASVNMAAARHPEVEFAPPVLWVPEGDDPDLARRPWRAAGPPVGFPAGKTKTMVLDVTDIVRRDDPRLRLTTTLQLALDAVRVALDADDAPFTETRLPVARATLGFRGFSRVSQDSGGGRPERFDYEQLDPPRWNQHPGLYTKYGEVSPLLGAADDLYVILGAGDALWAVFDAAALPPLPAGWTRDWLLELDGWAKDGDPNTLAAQRVEPLPFHGMSAYPPPEGESFPDDEAHRQWRAEWITRPAAVLLPPLAGTR